MSTFRATSAERGTTLTGDAKLEFVSQLFDVVAHRYDAVNAVLALGFVDRWRRKALSAGLVATFAPAFATSVKAIREYGPGHDETWARVGKDFAEAKNLNERSETGGYLELFYKVSFWTSLVVGGSFAFSPLSPLAIVNEMEPSSQLIQRAFGLATVFLLAPTQYILIDAAKRGRLGGGTFKKLNLSIAASIALIDWMTIYTFGAATALSPTAAQLENASGGVYNYVGALAVSASIVAVYLYQGVFAKK